MGVFDYNGPGATTPTTAITKPSTSFWGSVGHALGAAAGWLWRGASDIGHVLSGGAHDIASLGASLLPGGVTPTQAYNASRLIKPLVEDVARVEEPRVSALLGLITGKMQPTPGNVARALFSEPKLLEANTYKDPGTFLRTLAHDTTVGLVTPGVNTIANLTTPAGRYQALYEHPGFTVLDLLPFAEEVTPAIKSVMHALGETSFGAKVASPFADAAAKVSGEAARAVAPAFADARYARLTPLMRNITEDIVPAARRLDAGQEAELFRRLQFGDQPPVGDPLREPYDQIAAHAQASGEHRVTRVLPEPYKNMIKTKALYSTPPGQSLSYFEKMTRGVMRHFGISEEEAAGVMAYVRQAIKDDAPNPFPSSPEMTSTWKQIQSHIDSTLKAHQRNYNLVQEPFTEGLYTAKEMSKFRKKVAGGAPGRGVNLAKIAEDMRQFGTDHPTPEAIAAKRAELEAALARSAAKAGDFSIDISPANKYWAISSRPDLPHLGPFDTAQEAAAAVREYVRSTTSAKDLQAQLDSLNTLDEKLQVVSRYKKTLAEMPPARFKPLVESFIRDARDDQFAIPVAPQMADAYRQAAQTQTDSAEAAIIDAVLKGKRPVYVHREALREGETLRGASFRPTTPASSKPATGLAKDYATGYWALTKDEAQWMMQEQVLNTVPKIWAEDGAHTWFEQMADGKAIGRKNPAGFIDDHFYSLDFDKRGVPQIGKAREGSLLITKARGEALKHVFNPETQRGFWRKSTDLWMVPTLGLSPAFIEGNALSGAMLYGFKAGPSHLNPFTFLRDAKEAISMGLRGEILDPRVPGGTGLGPRMSKYLSPTAEVASASWYGEGLASAFRHFFSKEENIVARLAGFTDYMNHFLDGLYKNMTAMSHSPGWKNLRNLDEGVTGITDKAAFEASTLMQDMETLTPFEREVMQRLIPFYAWKRTLLRYVWRYPQDHPVRMTIMNQIARQHEEQRKVSQWIDDYLLHYIPVGPKDAKDFQAYMSNRLVDPFADFSDMATLKGWINSINPVALNMIRFFTGYQPYLGGTPAYARKDEVTIDPQTGAHVRKYDWKVFLDLVPQLRIMKDKLNLQPPEEDTPQGWYDWWKQYGPALRLLPALQYINLQQEELKHLQPGEKPSFKAPKTSAPKSSGGGIFSYHPSSLTGDAKIYQAPYNPNDVGTRARVIQGPYVPAPEQDVTA